MLTIRMKSMSDIQGTLEEFEDKKNTDGILFKRDIIIPLIAAGDVELLAFTEYDLGIALKVRKPDGGYTHISHKWVKTIDDEKFLDEVTKIDSNYIKLDNNKVIDIQGKTVKNLSDLPICSCCGTPTSHIIGGVRLCETCLSDKYAKVHEYSYVPNPLNFTGNQLKGDKDSPIHYGIELELGCRGKKEMAMLCYHHQDEVYLKKDGSITGGDFKVELVSHPHTFKALMDDCYLDKLATLSIEENRDTNGCHVHISRTAFVDDKHYAKWYFLIHEMKNINEYIGGRALNNYCSFNPSGIIGTKSKDIIGGPRGMINERKQHTIEARFFSSTNSPDEVRSYIQYLESLIKYTKYSDDTVTVEGWRAYTRKHSKKFEILNARLDRYTGSFSGGVVYKEPVIVRKAFNELTIVDLKKVHKLLLTDGSTIAGVSYVEVYRDRLIINYADEDRCTDEINISRAQSVEIIE